MDSPPTNTQTPPQRGQKKDRKPLTARRLRRKIWRGLLFCVFLLALTVFVVTRTGVTRAIILPRLEAATNLRIDARSVVVAADLSVVIRDARIRIPGIDGEAGEILSVGEMTVSLDWLELPSPMAVKVIQLESPRLRISQSTDTGDITIASLALVGRARGGEITEIPSVRVHNGALEMGEYGAAGYTRLAEIPFSGVLAPQRDVKAGRSDFSLTPLAGESGFNLTGWIDDSGVTFSVGGLALDEWPADAIPSRMRELWEQLALDGRIVPRWVKLSASGDVEIVVNVDQVAVSLPFTADTARSDERVRLTDVNGSFTVTERTVSADLIGRVSTLTERVVFDMWGFDPETSPFAARLTTEPFRLERDLDLLKYVPEIAHEQNERFGRPEADVEATIWLAQGNRPDGMPAPMTGTLDQPDRIAHRPDDEPPDELRLDGVLDLSHGTAAFEGFPYPFHDMSGAFRFTQHTLTVDNVRGVGPTGAVLVANGTIGPLGDIAKVDLAILVHALPIDDALKQVLSPSRRDLLDALISERQYEGLVTSGLLRSRAEAEQMRQHLAALDAEAQAWTAGGIAAGEMQKLEAERARIRAELSERPGFDLGGVADATIEVHRALGEVSHWTRTVRLHLQQIGLLSEYFPMPTTGHEVDFTIDDGQTTFTVTNAQTISGGRVSINAQVMFDDETPPLPTVDINASDVPIDDMLIHAIAGPNDRGRGPDELTRVLGKLNLSGTLDCSAKVVPRDGHVNYHIDAKLVEVAASVADASIGASGIAGEVTVEPSRVALDLAGVVEPADLPVKVEGARLAASITLPEGRTWGDHDADPAEPRIEASVTLPSADVRLPAERLIEVFDKATADRVAELRAKHHPQGVVDAASSLSGRLGADGIDLDSVFVSVTRIDRLAFDAEGLHLDATDGQGAVTLDLAGDKRAVFDGFSVDLTADGVPSGRLSVSDTIPLGDEIGTGADWRLALDRGRFESPLTRTAIAHAGAAAVEGLFDRYRPGGVFDLSLHHRADEAFEGEVAPASLAVETPRGRVEFEKAEGSVAFGPGGGTLNGLKLSSPGTTMRASGGWQVTDGTTGLDFTFGLDTQQFTDALLGLAPDEVGSLFDALGVGVDGPVSIDDLRLVADTGDAGGIGRFLTTGAATLTGGRLNIGVPVTDLDGTLHFEAGRNDPDTAPTYALSLEADRWRLHGLRMTNGRAEVLSGREPGSVLVPVLTADVHGGRFTGRVRMAQEPSADADLGADSDRRYWSDFQLAEVRLAPLLEDVRVGGDTSLADEVREDVREAYDADLWDQSADRSRGLVNASFSLTGFVESKTGRRGRGRIIASGGPVVMLPLLTPLIEFSNLRPPIGDELGIALADLHLDDAGVTFDDIAVFGDSIELLGYGDMTWPDGRLDLRVRSKAVRRIPVVSAMVETVRDELLTTHLTGPIGEPTISAETFAGTRRVMGSLLGGENGGGDRLREIGRSAEAARQRLRLASQMLDRVGAEAFSPRPANDVP
ncbi:MAG: hypothetical protein H6810_04430 [Phycisphaeraceae bacterium]|nr:MAG: hypothetical protein H6810_04430 [Phycisphaeraceae bacterium]